MRVVGYGRVSTEHPAPEGVSLDAQRTRIKARQLGERLYAERILSPLSNVWHAASVRDLLIEFDRRKKAA